jgi:hypothetical protein
MTGGEMVFFYQPTHYAMWRVFLFPYSLSTFI